MWIKLSYDLNKLVPIRKQNGVTTFGNRPIFYTRTIMRGIDTVWSCGLVDLWSTVELHTRFELDVVVLKRIYD
jgi:hypothetical protein